MKKVFRIWKFVQYAQEHNLDAAQSLKLGWPFELEGKTKEEIAQTDFDYADAWMVFEDENKKKKKLNDPLMDLMKQLMKAVK